MQLLADSMFAASVSDLLGSTYLILTLFFSSGVLITYSFIFYIEDLQTSTNICTICRTVEITLFSVCRHNLSEVIKEDLKTILICAIYIYRKNIPQL